MKKKTLLAMGLLWASVAANAGDYLTNTNYNAAFLRKLATGASTDITSTFSNPAGLSFLPADGFHLMFSGQSAYQTRNIEATTPLWTMNGENTTREFKGKASAPFLPSIMMAYKKGNWTISGGFTVTGGGGKASFGDGLPMFNALVIGMTTQRTQGKLLPSMYNINSSLTGKQFIYGGQIGASYRVNDWLSVFGGGRMNYFYGGYEGYLNAQTKGNNPTTLTQFALDITQTGWGITPMIGAHVELDKWSIGLKYEFKTNLNIENKAKKFEIGAIPEAYMADYAHGVNTPNDIPAFFSAAVQYKVLPTLRATVEYHFFDDKNAGMASVNTAKGKVGKETTLKHGTHEILFGAEWDVHEKVTLSAGYQNTNYGLSDDFQTDTSFSCDSYSIGFGARFHLSEVLKLDAGYMFTNYKDYTKVYTAYKGIPNVPGKDVYSRTNKVFGLSVSYQF